MTHEQSMNFRQIGSGTEKMLRCRWGRGKGAGAQTAMPQLQEGIPDYVVRFDERE